ncbi:MAG TPA: isoaspartyl peptidase/L-asparaginase [Thermoanaerobaculia bacterium]|nr:isoaspartyl peptidase/L-asparaginase [Thermoanaerobaculia bacterium]
MSKLPSPTRKIRGPRLSPTLVASCLAILVSGCQREPEPAPATAAPEESSEADAASEAPRLEWAVAIHGGAGVVAEDRDPEPYYQTLEAVLRSGAEALAQGEAALAVVERLVILLEDDPKFNAGRGAVFTSAGTHELDAAIMDGRTLAAGAVAGVRYVRNPVSLARAVLERSPHVLLAGQGADDFAREQRLRRVPPDYFSTPERLQQLREARRRARDSDDRSTVGAVALDRYGNLAAATSTGGMTNKRWGRVGDVPLIGAGTYADNATAAISCTGRGEEFIRHVVAHDVASRVAYKNLSLQQAAEEVVQQVLAEGDGGLIAVDRHGRLAMVFNTPGMFRGAADATGRFEVGVREIRMVSGAAGSSVSGSPQDAGAGGAIDPGAPGSE